MLGGKYNLATRNMPAKYVKNVEVLSNHHDALVDKGKPSDDVALNVTLDNSVRFKPVGLPPRCSSVTATSGSIASESQA